MADGIVTFSNHYKYALKKKLIDESGDTIRVLLMRSGFVFNKDDHAQLKNIKGTITASTIAFVDGGAGTDSITDTGNGLITAGFVVGNSVTITGGTNNGVVVIPLTVAAGVITLVTGSLTASEGAGSARTLTAEDELAAGGGYTQNTKTTGTVTVTEDDTNNRCDSTFPTVTWTALAANIGPTPGALIYDYTADVIICYLDFGGEVTKSPPDSLNIGNGTLRAA